jgi:thymidylate kinase
LAKEEPERYRVIDGAQPPDAVGQAVWDCVAPLL